MKANNPFEKRDDAFDILRDQLNMLEDIKRFLEHDDKHFISLHRKNRTSDREVILECPKYLQTLFLDSLKYQEEILSSNLSRYINIDEITKYKNYDKH